MTVQFQHWPSIENFTTLTRDVRRYERQIRNLPITYKAKIKLHGTNAGITFSDGDFRAQSRTQLITVNDDNAGFAKWVDGEKEYFAKLAAQFKTEHRTVTVFGEWCGQGIFKAGISQIGKKIFAVFAIQFGESDSFDSTLIVEPTIIKEYLGDQPETIVILPWFGTTYEYTIDIDFYSEKLEEAVTPINEIVAEIDKEDPWVKAVFGVAGGGEGLVFYPHFNAKTMVARDRFRQFVFKVKGETHKVRGNKKSKSITVDLDKLNSIGEFVTSYVTDARMEQFAGKVNDYNENYDIRLLGTFLSELCRDIEKEGQADLEESGLVWRDLAKSIGKVAANWYKGKCRIGKII